VSGPGHRRRWWQWLLAGTVLLVVFVVAGAAIFVKSQPSSVPLTLPLAAAKPPAGPAGGTWDVAAGSVAGFRIRESALGFGDDVTGTTIALTGTAVIAGGRVTSAVFRIGLTAITVGGKPRPQFATSLDTAKYPDATITLADPVRLPAGFGAGRTVTVAFPGRLTLRGVTRPVTITLSARRDGAAVEAAGSLPVASGRWGITLPAGFGFLGGLSSQATAEFLLILHRREATRTRHPDLAHPAGLTYATTPTQYTM
jgi:polyisoprenoid-binding protein YceI